MTQPIPGLRGIAHIGLTVPNMDQALGFFFAVLGAELLYEDGPFQADDNWMAVNLGVDPKAIIPRLTMIRIANGPLLELFEYEAPDRDTAQPKNSDTGGYHLALYVDDIEAALSNLRDHGLTVQGEVKPNAEGPSTGLNWVYFLAPWGLQLELISHPNGVKAFTDRQPPIWQP